MRAPRAELSIGQSIRRRPRLSTIRRLCPRPYALRRINRRAARGAPEVLEVNALPLPLLESAGQKQDLSLAPEWIDRGRIWVLDIEDDVLQNTKGSRERAFQLYERCQPLITP